jgi:hypothetical protein
MALRSAPALLKAIEGFRGETAGSREHEGINAHLSRVAEEVKRGHSTPQDSPGRREAQGVAQAAFQRNHPSEQGHSAGDGQVRSNEPGSAHPADQPPGPVSERQGSGSDKLRGAEPPPSHDNVHSAAPSTGFTGAEAEIRRAAAERELSRPDTKIHATAEKNRPGGQRESVAPAPPARKSGRLGEVSAPEIANTQRPGEAERAGKESATQPESRPPFIGESLLGDGWSKAAAKTKAKLAMKAGAR